MTTTIVPHTFPRPVIVAPAEATGSFLYEDCDVPADMSLTAYRRQLDGHVARRARRLASPPRRLTPRLPPIGTVVLRVRR